MFCPMIKGECVGEDCYWFDNYGCAVSKTPAKIDELTSRISDLEGSLRDLQSVIMSLNRR